MTELKAITVGEMVSENYRVADVFKQHKIDFCCGGNVGLKEVCDQRNLNYDKIIEEIKLLDNGEKALHNYNQWELDFLIDYIVNVHHNYVNHNLPIIAPYAEKVASVHGDEYPETIKISSLFREIASELSLHLSKEETVLFPYIKTLMKNKKDGAELTVPEFQGIQIPVNLLVFEHENAGSVFKEIEELSNNFAPPEHACNTFMVYYAKLKEFQEDLHTHIHLENNILFPKAIKLEDELTSSLESQS